MSHVFDCEIENEMLIKLKQKSNAMIKVHVDRATIEWKRKFDDATLLAFA